MEYKVTNSVQFKVSMDLNENEARALDAIAGYGTDAFLKAFYEVMGKSYLQPHEAGVKTLFSKIRGDLNTSLNTIDKAKRALQEVK